MIELYDYHLSSDAYKVRLLLHALHLSWTTHEVEFYPRREHRAEWFLRINPRGELPVIIDDGTIIEDAGAILLHLARTHDPARTWYPADPIAVGAISTWLTFADALTQTAAAARLHDGFFYHHVDVATCRRGAHDLLRVLDERLWFGEQAGSAWLCGGTIPTIADIACFPDVMLAGEGGISLRDYPAIRRWTDRFKRLPGFVVMPGIFA
jgi:glutathione S-transferase